MLVRVTTATPEQVGTLVAERALAEAGMPNQCEPRSSGLDAATPSCLWQRRLLGPELRGEAPSGTG